MPRSMPRTRLSGPMTSPRRDLHSPAVKTDIVLPHLPDDKRTRVGGGFEHSPWTDRQTDRFVHINQSQRRSPAAVEDPVAESPPVNYSQGYQKPQMGYDIRWEFTVESEFRGDVKRKFTMRRDPLVPTEDVTLAALRSKLKKQHQGKLPEDFVVRAKSSQQELATDAALTEALAEPANNPLRLTIERRTRSTLEEWVGLSMYKDIGPVLEELRVKEPDDLTRLWPEELEQIKAQLKKPVQVATFEKKHAALTKKPKKKKGASRQVQKFQPQVQAQDTASYRKTVQKFVPQVQAQDTASYRRTGGGFDYGHEYEGLTDDDEPVPEISSPNRRAKAGFVRGFGQRRNTISWKPKRKSGKGPESILCERPVTVGKCVMWFLIVHCSLEIWGVLSAFRDWFACNFYPEYTDLMWDVLCGVFVAVAAAFVVGSTVGCECICCTVVRSSEKVEVTRGSTWPKYLYTLACLSAIAAAVFGAHPAVVSNDPFAEELSVRRGPPSDPDSLMEGSGINEGRRRATEHADPLCTQQVDDEPIAWCVSATAERPYDQDVSATNKCTDVMKYAGCADGVEDDSCAEEMPYPSWHVQAETGHAQNACILNSAEETCKYEFSRVRSTVPCPPPPQLPPPPPPPHGYTIVRCVEAIWTARVLVLAMICRVIGAVVAGLFSLAVCIITPSTYKAPGPNGAATDDPEGARTLVYNSKSRLAAADDVQTEPSFAATQLVGRSSSPDKWEGDPTRSPRGATQTAPRPENFSSPAVGFSPIQSLNRSENQWSDTPARPTPMPEPEPEPEPQPDHYLHV